MYFCRGSCKKDFRGASLKLVWQLNFFYIQNKMSAILLSTDNTLFHFCVGLGKKAAFKVWPWFSPGSCTREECFIARSGKTDLERLPKTDQDSYIFVLRWAKNRLDCFPGKIFPHFRSTTSLDILGKYRS